MAITGGNIGIGITTAEECARAGAAHITILCRNLKAAAEAEKAIAKARTDPNTKISVVSCDLGDLNSVRESVKVLQGEAVHFDVLFLNAGVMMVPQGLTKDGFETHIGVNHYGHFLLVNLIHQADLLKAGARVVCLSSHAHYTWSKGFDINDLNFERRPYTSGNAYSASKTANILMAKELQRRFQIEGKGRTAISLHPGFVRTKMVREPGLTRFIVMLVYPLYWSVSLSPVEGVQCSLYAATTPDISHIAGKFLENLVVSEPLECVNSANAKRLWEVSERAVGLPSTNQD